MQKQISPKITALTFGILTIAFLAVFYVVAWTEPGQTPPQGNVPAPINVGPTGQSKAGGLILNTGGAVNGLIIDKGNLCLGTDCRSSWPNPVGVPSGMISMFDTNCPTGWTRFAALDNRVPRGAATYGGTGGGDNHSHSFSLTIIGAPAGGQPAAIGGTFNTGFSSSWPPYLNVVWCKKD